MTNNFVEQLRKATSYTTTENGALTHSTTLNSVLDLFAMGGAIRTREKSEVEQLFVKAFSEDPQLALRCLFYLRDIRGGQGERQTFKTIIKYMAEYHTHVMMPLLHLIPEYGRYDDLYALVGTPLEANALQILKNVAYGINGFKQDNLVFKWLKSENTSSKESRELAHKTRAAFALSSSSYRKLLSMGRSKVAGLVERPMSFREWKSINYEQVPSKASLKYRKAFSKRDAERYVAYLESVKKGEKKINAATLYPSDLVAKVIHTATNDNTVEALWKALPNYVQKEQNALVMADVSGSMQGQPITISIALALYFAERNKGKFANHYLTFSSVPTLAKVQGISLTEKVRFVLNNNVGYDTNLQAAFELLLAVGIRDRVPQEEMPSTIYVISDMEFNDSCVRGLTNHKALELKYTLAGYKMPQLVYWNVASRHNNLPVTHDANGVSLVSGYSPVLFRQVVEGKTPVELMLQVLNAKRYEQIVYQP